MKCNHKQASHVTIPIVGLGRRGCFILKPTFEQRQTQTLNIVTVRIIWIIKRVLSSNKYALNQLLKW